MGTDIYGGIEYRHPAAGMDWFEWEPWLRAIDLYPLYDERDYAAFGYLFGVCNFAGFEPVAAGRGLPSDVSSHLRAELEPMLAAGEMGHASWVTWAELAALTPAVASSCIVGCVTWTEKSKPWSTLRYFVPAEWPPEMRDKVGPPPPGWDPTTELTEWETGELICQYRALSLDTILGAGTHWPHVFAVMRALAGRFGDDGVRLVVAFD